MYIENDTGPGIEEATYLPHADLASTSLHGMKILKEIQYQYRMPNMKFSKTI